MAGTLTRIAVLLGTLLVATSAIFFLMLPPVQKLEQKSIETFFWKGPIGPDQQDWLALRRISHNMIHALIIAEDANYFDHDGLDWNEILKSIFTNIRQGRYARGASTITQQTVKLAFLSPEKTISRKFREAIGALWLERTASKEKILEWYVNLLPFGHGQRGVEQAADFYFKTKPELLTIDQSIHLALILPSPNTWSEGLMRQDLTDFGHRRFASLLTQMLAEGFVTKEQWISTMASGNFGRPIKGFDTWLEKQNSSQDKPLDCTVDPETCIQIFSKDLWDEATDSLVFPPISEDEKDATLQGPPPNFAPSDSTEDSTEDSTDGSKDDNSDDTD